MFDDKYIYMLFNSNHMSFIILRLSAKNFFEDFERNFVSLHHVQGRHTATFEAGEQLELNEIETERLKKISQ